MTENEILKRHIEEVERPHPNSSGLSISEIVTEQAQRQAEITYKEVEYHKYQAALYVSSLLSKINDLQIEAHRLKQKIQNK